MERNYENGMTFFEKANYDNLLKEIGTRAKAGDPDAKEDAIFFEQNVANFHEYVRAVDLSETHIKMAYFRLEGDELRWQIESFDRQRRSAHEAAITSLKALNRIAKFYGVPSMFTGDIDNRHQIADFCLDITVQIFKDRTL